MRLKGKSALVTGAARGIGLAIANTFAREGSALAVADLDGAAANAAAASRTVQRTNGSDSDYIGVDVGIDGSTDYAFERFERNTFNFSVGRRRVPTTGADSENLLASGSMVAFPRLGLDGVVPVVNFLSAENFLGTNADGNVEVWQGRVQ